MKNEEEILLQDKERLLELLSSTLSLFNSSHNLGDNFLTGELNLSIFENYKCVLIGELLDKEENFNLENKLEKLRYSHGLKENYYYNPLLKILREMHQEQIDSTIILNVFIKKLEKYIESIKAIPLSEYVLIFPINLNFKEGIPIQFLKKNKDISIELVPYSIFRKYLESIELYIENHYGERRIAIPNYGQEEIDLIENCNHGDNYFFIVKVHARNVGFAVKRASNNIELNAGLYSLIVYYQMSVTVLGGDPFEKKISEIDTPIVYVFNNEELINVLFSTYRLLRKSKSIDFNQLNNIVNVMNNIQQFHNEKLKNLIYNALISYYSALKTSEHSISFLFFWNIIEQLLLKTKDTKLKEIIRRLKLLYSNNEKSKRDIIEIIDKLHKKRNLFVHESIDKITENDRDNIKGIVEQLIKTFLDVSIRFKDFDMLDFFYQNLGNPLNKLQEKSKVLHLLENIKSRDSIDNR